MLEMEQPYFMTNPDWWYVDEDAQMRIKDDAPEKAKKSFREWVSMDWLNRLMKD